MSAWSSMVEARKTFLSLWAACSCVAVVCAIGVVFGISALHWISVIFCLLAAHAFTAWVTMGKIADLQAALDMRSMALDMVRRPALVTTCETIKMRGDPLKLRARDGTQFEARLVGLYLDGETADIQVRYLG